MKMCKYVNIYLLPAGVGQRRGRERALLFHAEPSLLTPGEIFLGHFFLEAHFQAGALNSISITDSKLTGNPVINLRREIEI